MISDLGLMRLADYVLDFCKLNGVEHIFYLPGGAAMHLNDALAKVDEIEAVTCLHEQACAIAAEAYARISEKVGVVMVTSGPGTTNTITGLAGAWLDSTPVFFCLGRLKLLT